MNVVGKFGSLIAQGVYSVATPIHPFGGAVDIIAVQQQDGSFRSTPWYVRFGKFQGVLKGAEKIVRIEVNGVEANFYMHLDNSGEAYFIREIVSSKEGEGNDGLKDSDSLGSMRDDCSSIDYNDTDDGRKENVNRYTHEGSVSGTVEVLQDEHISLGVDRIERMESDSERAFYEFQDEQSSLEDSLELSEYGSSRYENLDSVDSLVESQNSNSEVVLVSVDGHILTAPISSSERNPENMQLSIPQFHLGPGEGTEFCEGNAEFSTSDTWAADYLGDLDKSVHKVYENDSKVNSDTNAHTVDPKLEVHEGNKEEDVGQVQETQNIANEKREQCVPHNSDNRSISVKRDDIFKSCLELHELDLQVGNANQQDKGSSLEIQGDDGDPQEKSPQSLLAVGEAEDGGAGILISSDRTSPLESDAPSSLASPSIQVEAEPVDRNTPATAQNLSDSIPVHSFCNDEELHSGSEQIQTNSEQIQTNSEQIQTNPQGPASEGECCKSQTVGTQTSSSNEETKTDLRFEISLCGNLLSGGMGLSAAAEAFDTHRISEDEFKLSAASLVKNENLVVRFQEMYLPWDKAAPIVLGMAAYGLVLPVEHSDAIPVEQGEAPKPREDESGLSSTPSGRRWRLWSIPFRRVKTLEHTASDSSEEVFVDSESGSQNQPVEPTPISRGGNESPHKQLLRTNVPTTEDIASLNLKEGQNMVNFIFSAGVLGKPNEVQAHIYLWKWNTRIVISDVDGTITKSDVLGQVMPLVGKDWTQSGVARLFSAIKENGYQLLFLSARAIIQAYLTRSFLVNLKQDGKALPHGPVVISPDGLFPSLYREVIRRAPHEFKIACLEDIKALFPADYNPFYAGFGNRDTDELSYRKIGIPKGKIFIINPKGEVANSHRIDVKSYTSLHTLVNDMFPPTSMLEQEDYNSWNYWRMPLPEIDNL